MAGRRYASGATTVDGSVAGSYHGHNPVYGWACIGLGLAGFAFSLLILVTQIQTSQAFILHGGQVELFKPNWGILWQPVDLMTGQLTTDEAIAVVTSWVAELIYLMSVVGGTVVLITLRSAGRVWGSIFGFLVLVIIIYNSVSDFRYGGTLGSGNWGHFAFMLLMFFGTGFLWVLSSNFIIGGYRSL